MAKFNRQQHQLPSGGQIQSYESSCLHIYHNKEEDKRKLNAIDQETIISTTKAQARSAAPIQRSMYALGGIHTFGRHS
ncbi:hypothetical protein J2TS6_01860 [Paenibacillus albilobatus]|uniref:Uncharacterized protein n=1 Tax=Paenibacillus albilobatus TaxID=2716884 RepID=A0A919XEB2_9BACL|nr:hypothetical protein J2TS6_01860 [Paenibacillus albilobatus]